MRRYTKNPYVTPSTSRVMAQHERRLAEAAGYKEPAKKPPKVRKKPVQSIRGSKEAGYVREQRMPTTTFGDAGESIQAHMIYYRKTLEEFVSEILQNGHEVWNNQGVACVRFSRVITWVDLAKISVLAMTRVGLSDSEIQKKLKVGNIFTGNDRGAIGQAWLDLMLSGDESGAEKFRKQYKEKALIKDGLQLLTLTTKMGCYSFNLPAGPAEHGGTCPASGLGFMFSSPERQAAQQRHLPVAYPRSVGEGNFICNGCYALKGSYGSPNVMLGQEFKRQLVEIWLKAGSFERIMTDMIKWAQQKSNRQYDNAEKARAQLLEMLPGYVEDMRPEMFIPHPNFFRIHDAGDMYSTRYAKAWMQVIERFKGDIQFWAPTRMWALGKMPWMAGGIPENLTLRPSALHFGDEAPPVKNPGTSRATLYGLPVPGMSAGSGAGKRNAPGTWFCPAMEPQHLGGGLFEGKVGKATGARKAKKEAAARAQETGQEEELVYEGSTKRGYTCAAAHGPNSPIYGGDNPDETPEGYGCRACWLHRELDVFYGEH